jgi:hypothetical protein
MELDHGNIYNLLDYLHPQMLGLQQFRVMPQLAQG